MWGKIIPMPWLCFGDGIPSRPLVCLSQTASFLPVLSVLWPACPSRFFDGTVPYHTSHGDIVCTVDPIDAIALRHVHRQRWTRFRCGVFKQQCLASMAFNVTRWSVVLFVGMCRCVCFLFCLCEMALAAKMGVVAFLQSELALCGAASSWL